MKSKTLVLVRKELLGVLRNPQMIASLVLIPVMFIAMGGLTSIGVQKAVEEAKAMKIVVLVLDTGGLAGKVAEKLRGMGAEVVYKPPPQEPKLLVVVPEGFSHSLEEFLENPSTPPPRLRVSVELEGASIAATARLEAATQAARLVEEAVKQVLAEEKGLPPSLLSIHFQVEGEVLLGSHRLGLVEAQAVIGALASTFFVALFVIALAAQYATLSMAQEKEDKAFETLLSQPVDRAAIGTAKTIGALVVTGIQVALFAASWYYYISTLPGEQGATGQATIDLYTAVMEVIGVQGAAVVIAELLVAAIAATLLGLIAGALSSDTRAAGVAIGPLWMIVVGAGLTAQMIGIPATPETGLLGATIVLGPPIALQAAITQETGAITTTIISTLATTALLALALKKLLESEAIITGLGVKQRLKQWRQKP